MNPPALLKLWDRIHEGMPAAQLSGIEGDSAHYAEGGYHVPRRYVPASDYSVQLAVDRQGDPDYASAIDISLSPDLMKVVSQRLLTAMKNEDPRVYAVREFFGTVDGQRVIGWDRHDPAKQYDNTPTTSDSSHLWHIHISIYRAWNNDPSKVLPVADVFCGHSSDPLEVIMAWYADKQEFEAAVEAAAARGVWSKQIVPVGGTDADALPASRFVARILDKVIALVTAK